MTNHLKVKRSITTETRRKQHSTSIQEGILLLVFLLKILCVSVLNRIQFIPVPNASCV
jgi:hypothetical protein